MTDINSKCNHYMPPPRGDNLLWLRIQLRNGRDLECTAPNDLLALQDAIGRGSITVREKRRRGAPKLSASISLVDIVYCEVLGVVGVRRETP